MTTNIIYKIEPPKLPVVLILFKLLATAKGRKHLWDTFWK